MPPPDAAGRSTIPLPPTTVAAGDELTLTITAVDPRWTTDRRYAEQVVVPSSIAEIEGLPVAPPSSVTLPECRDDLVELDGAALPLRIDAPALESLRAGGSVTVPTCDGAPVSLAAGRHVITSSDGRTTGVDVDRVVLDGRGTAGAGTAPARPRPPSPSSGRARPAPPPSRRARRAAGSSSARGTTTAGLRRWTAADRSVRRRRSAAGSTAGGSRRTTLPAPCG